MIFFILKVVSVRRGVCVGGVRDGRVRGVRRVRDGRSVRRSNGRGVRTVRQGRGVHQGFRHSESQESEEDQLQET